MLVDLQRMQPQLPPAYIVENVALQYNFASQRMRECVYPQVIAALGAPFTADAVQFGSYAHRLRNF